jgi:hypothetical protein
MKKCILCGETEESHKKKGYDFKVIKSKCCNQYFCEACLIDGNFCPECSNLVEV